MYNINQWLSAKYRYRAGILVPQHLTFNGTSHTQNTTSKAQSYPSQFAAALNAAGFLTTTDNWWGIKSAIVSGVATTYDPLLTITGAWSSFGITFGRESIRSTTVGNTVRYVPSINTDTAVWFYRTESGGGSFNIDAGAGAIGGATSCNGAFGVLNSVTKTATLGANTWTATIAAGPVWLSGAYFYNSANPQFIVHNGGGSGYLASNIATAQGYLDTINALNPVLASTECGTNDAFAAQAQTGTTLDATLRAYETSMRSAYGAGATTAARIMLTDPPTRVSGSGDSTTQDAQERFANINRAVALFYNTPVVDVYASRPGLWVADSANGLKTDNLHDNINGNLQVAQMLSQLLI